MDERIFRWLLLAVEICVENVVEIPVSPSKILNSFYRLFSSFFSMIKIISFFSRYIWFFYRYGTRGRACNSRLQSSYFIRMLELSHADFGWQKFEPFLIIIACLVFWDVYESHYLLMNIFTLKGFVTNVIRFAVSENVVFKKYSNFVISII